MSQKCIDILKGAFKENEISRLQASVKELIDGGMVERDAAFQTLEGLLDKSTQEQLQIDALIREAQGLPQYIQPVIPEVEPDVVLPNGFILHHDPEADPDHPYWISHPDLGLSSTGFATKEEAMGISEGPATTPPPDRPIKEGKLPGGYTYRTTPVGTWNVYDADGNLFQNYDSSADLASDFDTEPGDPNFPDNINQPAELDVMKLPSYKKLFAKATDAEKGHMYQVVQKYDVGLISLDEADALIEGIATAHRENVEFNWADTLTGTTETAFTRLAEKLKLKRYWDGSASVMNGQYALERTSGGTYKIQPADLAYETVVEVDGLMEALEWIDGALKDQAAYKLEELSNEVGLQSLPNGWYSAYEGNYEISPDLSKGTFYVRSTYGSPPNWKEYPDLPTALRRIKRMEAEAQETDAKPSRTEKSLQLDWGTKDHIKGMKRTGEQLGSNKGGWFEDAAGESFYIKQNKNADQTVSEHVTRMLYLAGGVPTPMTFLSDGDFMPEQGWDFLDPVIASKKIGPEKGRALKDDFVFDAWLANWDVIGLAYDNYIGTKDQGVRIDFGGALNYRAQGELKVGFNHQVNELKTLRDPNVNAEAASVFKDVTDQDIIEQAQRLAKIPDDTIRAIVTSMYGPEDLRLKYAESTAITLMQRKQFILDYAADLAGKQTVTGLEQWTEGWNPNNPKQIEDTLFNTNPHTNVLSEIEPYNSRYGVLVIDPQSGKVLLRKPSGNYDGYHWTFSKGGAEPGEHPAAAGKRETMEETGYDTHLTGLLAKPFYSATNTGAIFYVGVVNGEQTAFGSETEQTTWATYDEAKALIKEGTNLQGVERDLQILEYLFGKKTVSAIAEYPVKKGAAHAKSYYESGQFAVDAPFASFLNKDWNTLTDLQQLYVKSAAVMKNQIGDLPLTHEVINEEVSRMKAAFKKWTGGFTFNQVLGKGKKPTSELDMIKNFPVKTGQPFVSRVYHGTDSGIKGDVLDPQRYAGTSSGSPDTKALGGVFFMADTVSGSQNWGTKVYQFYFTAKNPKVLWWNKGWGSSSFTQEIEKAAAEGHDATIFVNAHDSGGVYHQYVAHNAQQQVRTRFLENMGYSPSETAQIYESKPGQTVLPSETRAGFIEGASRLMGEDVIRQAIDEGILIINEKSKLNAPAGAFDPELGTMTINLDRIGKGETAFSVLLHEGKHAGLENVLTPEQIKLFHKDLLDLADRGNVNAQDSIIRSTAATADALAIEHTLNDLSIPPTEIKAEMDRVRAEIERVSPELLAEEDLAYYIQNAANNPELVAPGLWRRLLTALRMWWAQTQLGQAFAAAGIQMELTPEMAVELGKASVRAAVRGPRSQRAGAVSYASVPRDDAPSITDTPEFKEWFGKSVVVDENGKPLRVFHGSGKATIEEFKPAPGKEGVFFTDNPDVANTYRNRGGRRGTIYPVYLSLVEPLIIDAQGGNWGDLRKAKIFTKEGTETPWTVEQMFGYGNSWSEFLAKYVKNNTAFDGVIIRNVRDQGPAGTKMLDPSTVYITFNPEQIKSAVGNTGQFDMTDARILHSLDSTWTGVKRWWATDANNPLEEFELGIGQKIWAHIGDNLRTIAPMSKAMHQVAEVAKSKTSAEQSTINRLFLKPLAELGAKTGLTTQQLDEWFTARHVLLDDENWQNLEKRSWQFAKDLAQTLPNALSKQLTERRLALTQGEWIAEDGTKHNIPDEAVAPKMVQLVEHYLTQMEILQQQGMLGDKYAGWEQINLNWQKVKAHSAGMYSPGKVDVAGNLLPGELPRVNVDKVPDAQKIYKEHLGNAPLREMAQLMDKMTQYQLDLLVEGGKIAQAEADAMRKAHPHYVKTRRQSADNDKSFEFLKSRRAGQGKPKVRAGTIEYDPPVHVLQNTLEQAHKNAAAAQQNLAARYLYDLVTQNKKYWSSWFTTAPETIHRLDALGFLHDQPTSHQDDHSIPVTVVPDRGRAGKTIYIKPVPQNLRAKLFGAAMNRLGAQQQGAIGKMLGMANGVVRATAVSFSPAFLMANFFRDPATAAYNLQATVGKDFTDRFFFGKAGTKTGLRNAYKVLWDVYVKGYENAKPENIALVEEWEKAGGRQSFTQALKEMDDGWRSFNKALFKARTPGVKQTFQGLEFIEQINVLVENVSRFSAFQTVMDAYRRGEIPDWKKYTEEEALREAALISKELTTNFDRKGFSSSAIGLWHLFWNATVQGNAQVVMNLAKSPKLQKMVAGTVVLGLIFDLLGRALSDDDEYGRNEWDNIPDYVKERNIILPFKVGGAYIKIPAPWVYNTVWRAGGLLGEATTGDRDAVSIPLELAGLTMHTFNPVASPSLAQSLSPTALDPLVMAVENKNFAGNPIQPTSFPGAARLPESQLYWDSTPESYVWLAQALNSLTGGDVARSGWLDISPGVYQNTVEFFTAGVGKAIGQVFSMASIPWNEEEFNPRNVPILSTFAQKPGTQVDVQLYHERVAQILQADKAVKLYSEGKSRDLDKLRETKKEYAGELRLVSHVKDVERQLKSLRQRLRAAQGRKDTQRVKDLKDRINSVQRRFVSTYDKRMK